MRAFKRIVLPDEGTLLNYFAYIASYLLSDEVNEENQDAWRLKLIIEGFSTGKDCYKLDVPN